MMKFDHPMRWNRRACSLCCIGLAIVALVSPATTAFAVEGAYSNYQAGGYGDFFVGYTPEPGVYLRSDAYYYEADVDRSVLQGRARFDVDIDVVLVYPTVMVVTEKEFLGGRYAFGGLLALSYVDVGLGVAAPSSEVGVRDDRTGFGDPYLIPLSLYWQVAGVHINFYQAIVVPLGSYDFRRLANNGLNYWSFDTNLAVTWFNEGTGTELSAVVCHLGNTENEKTDYESGQEIHLDYMANQFLTESVALGLHGYYVKQITGDSGSGATLGNYKAESVGLGPAFLWMTKLGEKSVSFSAKWLHELDATNRPEGNNFYLSVSTDF
jgi:hypothetical protein